MLNQYTPLYYLAALAGLTMIVGGIWLVYKQKIYIDRATNQVTTEIDIPLVGKFKTNVPALALFALGFVPLLYPIYKSQTQYLTIHGKVTSQLYPVVVYAVVDMNAIQHDGQFNLPLPVLQNPNYAPKIIYVAGANPPLVFNDDVDATKQKNGAIELLPMQITGSQQAPAFEKNITVPPADF